MNSDSKRVVCALETGPWPGQIGREAGRLYPTAHLPLPTRSSPDSPPGCRAAPLGEEGRSRHLTHRLSSSPPPTSAGARAAQDAAGPHVRGRAGGRIRLHRRARSRTLPYGPVVAAVPGVAWRRAARPKPKKVPTARAAARPPAPPPGPRLLPGHVQCTVRLGGTVWEARPGAAAGATVFRSGGAAAH